MNVTTPTADGEYGAGEVIKFYVRFNYEVHVQGIPQLQLNVLTLNNSSMSNISNVIHTINHHHNVTNTTNTTNIYNSSNTTNYFNLSNITNTYINTTNITNTTNTTIHHHHNMTNTTLHYYHGLAYFTKFLDSKTLIFEYIVKSGDNVTNLGMYGEIVLHNQHTKVLRLSDQPIAPANLSVAVAAEGFSQKHAITINTDPPMIDTVYGINTTHPNGVFYPGENIYFTIRFTKPVVIQSVFGAINLLLKTGTYPQNRQLGYAAYQRVLSDHHTILFLYTVETTVNKTHIDILPGNDALQLAPYPAAYIRRLSTIPTTDAIVTTGALYNSGNSIRNRRSIAVFGYTPFVTSVTLIETHPKGKLNLYPDDYIIFLVKFTGRVIITCTPVVVLNVGYQREAIYLSGNQSSSFYFKYTVEMGDVATGISYRYFPEAFCLQSGCVYNSSCTLKADSTNPTLAGDPGLPLIGGSMAGGVAFTNSSYHIKPSNIARNTTIKSIYTTTGPGNYGAGNVIFFYVKFTDDVQFTTVNQQNAPKLYLNFPGGTIYADYSGGSLTKTLVFNYVVTANSTSIPELLPAHYTGGTTALRCRPSEFCTIRNRNTVLANLSTPTSVIVRTGIEIDVSQPKIIAVWSDKPTSPYDGVYSVGETINIYVKFDKDVQIVGRPPRIAMNTTGEILDQRFAIYNQAFSNTRILGFQYVVQVGDKTPNLRYFGPTLELFLGLCKIYRRSAKLVTQVDYRLPTNTLVAVNGSVIAIDSFRIPKITNVVSLTPDGRYGLGQTIYTKINFDHPVISTGLPYLLLNMGDHTGRAYCVSINESNYLHTTGTLTTPTSATKTLIFKYIVQLNDFNQHLDYADHYSFFTGLQTSGNLGDIYAASSSPSLSVSTDLPMPGSLYSLSGNSSIFINGEVSYQIGLEYFSMPGTYSLNQSVVIKMSMSKPVLVRGEPHIKLSVGEYPRYAVYSSGNLTETLYFSYEPQPGDFTNNLDYAINRRALSSAVDSFSLNGGAILTYDNISSLPALIHLNPLHGKLTGTKNISSENGIFQYLDLTIQERGPDYLLRFFSDEDDYQHRLTTTQTLFVSFTNEYELWAKNATKGNQVGWSIAISGDIS